MKVMCIYTENYGNDEFDGPNPNIGDILTVDESFAYQGIPSYTFVETGKIYAYSASRYWPIPDGKEADEEFNRLMAEYVQAALNLFNYTEGK